MTVPFEAPPLSLTSPLQAEKLCVSYGRRPVLSELDIAFPREQVTAIVGPNGCGKSTLLSALARLHTPQAGRITLERRDIRSYGARELAHALALLATLVRAKYPALQTDTRAGSRKLDRLSAGIAAK